MNLTDVHRKCAAAIRTTRATQPSSFVGDISKVGGLGVTLSNDSRMPCRGRGRSSRRTGLGRLSRSSAPTWLLRRFAPNERRGPDGLGGRYGVQKRRGECVLLRWWNVGPASNLARSTCNRFPCLPCTSRSSSGAPSTTRAPTIPTVSGPTLMNMCIRECLFCLVALPPLLFFAA